MQKSGMIVAICLLALAITVLSGCSRLTEWDQHAVDYVTATHQPVQSFADNGDYSELEPLRTLAEANSVLLFGETPHGLADNYLIELKLLKYLHGLGYRYLLIENGFESADILNRYLATGDDVLLTSMEVWRAPVAANNAEGLQFWRDVCAWNKSLSEDERISVWAVDVSHMTNDARAYIVKQINLLPDAGVAHRVTGLYQKAAMSYPGFKAFESELLRETSELNDPETVRLRLAVKSLKDLLAFRAYTDKQDETVIADYPNPEYIRERTMMASFRYFWEESGAPRTGKVFGIFGSWHTNLRDGIGPEGPFAYLLNTQFESTKGKVASISGQPLSGSFRDVGGARRSVDRVGWVPPAAGKALVKLGHPYMICIEAEGQPASAYVIIQKAVPARDRDK